MAHTPEVLADLVERLRRDPSIRSQTPPKLLIAANADNVTHTLERVDLELLLATTARCPPLELDRFATQILGWESPR